MSTRPLLTLTLMLLSAGSLPAQDAKPNTLAPGSDAAVTAVAGESWLTHLNRAFDDSSMGRTGRVGPAPGAGEDMAPPLTAVSLPSPGGRVTLRGSDLYRLDCRGCHGESGLGVPPEINSVINPVRATSVELVMGRMKNAGMDPNRAQAAKLAQQANAALLLRLHQGGESMPAFSHLREAEMRPLLAYLRELAGLPGAKNEQIAITESHVRVGELIVKSTCHTCHSAVGPNPSPQKLLNGAIPPLNSLTKRKREADFIQKVTQGAPAMMGTPAVPYRGRMPVFFYLSEEEAADVYLYLTLYPPSETPSPTRMMAGTKPAQPPASNGPGASYTAPVLDEKPSGSREASSPVELHMDALPWTLGFVVLLLGGGLVFTLREFRRLSSKRAAARTAAKHRSQPLPGWSLDALGKRPFPGSIADSNRIS